MAMLMRRGDFYCGGALINDQYVLTAAHCVRGFNKRQVSVRLLSHNRTDGRVSTIDRQLDKIIVHDGYSIRNLDNDIALLRFTEPVELRDPLRPVCLAEAGKTYDGELAVVTGWGAIKEGGFIADRLQVSRHNLLALFFTHIYSCRKCKYPLCHWRPAARVNMALTALQIICFALVMLKAVRTHVRVTAVVPYIYPIMRRSPISWLASCLGERVVHVPTHRVFIRVLLSIWIGLKSVLVIHANVLLVGVVVL